MHEKNNQSLVTFNALTREIERDFNFLQLRKTEAMKDALIRTLQVFLALSMCVAVIREFLMFFFS